MSKYVCVCVFCETLDLLNVVTHVVTEYETRP